MIRFLLCVICLILFFIIMVPVMLAAVLIRIRSKKTAQILVQACLRTAFHVILWLTGCRVTVKGTENLPVREEGGVTIRPCLFIANHRSVFDVVLAYAYTLQPVSFIAKKELRPIPFLGWMFTLMNGIYIDRKNLRQGFACIAKAESLITDDRISVWIFPEGTRSRGADENEMLPFRPGSFRAASQTGAPVIPVRITGTRNIMAGHIPFIRPCDIGITYGAPVQTESLSEDEQKHIGEYFRGIIKSM